MSTLPTAKLTPEQYLEIERAAEFKSEYCDGEMFAMAGAQPNHNRLCMDFALEAGGSARQRGCEIFGSDQRVLVEAAAMYTYPDVSIVCGEPRFQERDNLVNPTVLVEVTSKSTESYDRGRKFEHYRTIPSLQHYVLVSQDRVYVDLFTRQPNDQWLLSSASRLDDAIELTAIGCSVSLARLYARVKFD